MSPRFSETPIARPFARLSESGQREARRALRPELLALMDHGPVGVLTLRLRLAADVAGALCATLDDLVASGEITALGYGLYMRVPMGPFTRPVTPEPLQDLLLGALTYLTNLTHAETASVSTLASFLGLSIYEVATGLQQLERIGLVTFSDTNGEWSLVGTVRPWCIN